MIVADLPQELKLSDAQIIDALWKLTQRIEQLERDVDSIVETLAINSTNIRLLTKGFREIDESEDGRNIYLSSTLKERRTNAKAENKYKKYLT